MAQAGEGTDTAASATLPLDPSAEPSAWGARLISPRREAAIGYRTLEREVVVDELPVRGTIPPWLTGTLVRNGPGAFEAGSRSVAHWFDGLAMLHRFTVREGRVGYGNRFLRTKAFRAAHDRGTLAYREFATDPCRSIFRRVVSVFDPGITDNALVSVTRLGDAYVALTETPLPVVFDPDTLATLGYTQAAPGHMPTAHPHRDPDTGDLVNYATHFGAASTHRVYRQGAGKPRVMARLPVRRPAYMHSFAMSEAYLALTEFPFTVNPVELAVANRPMITNFRWDPKRGTRIRVLDRRTGERVGTFEGPPAFAFHHLAAWDEGGELVMDFCDHGDSSVIDRLYLRPLRGEEPGAHARGGEEPGEEIETDSARVPRLTRWRLDLGSGKVRDQVISDEALELPRLNEARCYLRPYRFAYGIGAVSPRSGINDRLVKIDVHSGEATSWAEPGCYPGEPVFVARPEARAEDDGVALSVVLDARAERSFLLVLDAGSMTELGRAEVPHHVPFGFHGDFYREGVAL
jgi:carotenoid cleavage dioxygenase-like enzyme